MTRDETSETLDIREKIAHIDLMLAQHGREEAQTDQRLRQKWAWYPIVVVISSMTAGAALFAAAFAFAKLFQ
jgi:hypothetical protein